MFDRIGEKIKTFTVVVTIIEMIASVVGGIYVMAKMSVWLGLLVIVVGCFIAWIGSFMLYGFGEIIVKLTEISDNLQDQKKLVVAKTLKQNQGADVKADAMIQEVIDTTLEQVDEDSDAGEEEEDLNKAKENECPNCFAKITPKDKECPNCGYKLGR